MDSNRQAEGREWSGGDGSGVDGSGVDGRAGQGRAGQGRAGQGRVPDCLGGLSRVGISSRSTHPWNGQPPSIYYHRRAVFKMYCQSSTFVRPLFAFYCPLFFTKK